MTDTLSVYDGRREWGGGVLCVHDDLPTYSPLSLFSRGQIEDVPLVSSIWFIMRLNVDREFLNKGTGIPEEPKKDKVIKELKCIAGGIQKIWSIIQQFL